MKRTHQQKIGELFDQLQSLIQDIEIESSYVVEYPDHSRGQTIQVVKVDMALCTALDQLSVAAEIARS